MGIFNVYSRSERRQIRGTHGWSFRPGEWARIIGVKIVTPPGLSPRPCYQLQYVDGAIDYIAISDVDHYEVSEI